MYKKTLEIFKVTIEKQKNEFQGIMYLTPFRATVFVTKKGEFQLKKEYANFHFYDITQIETKDSLHITFLCTNTSLSLITEKTNQILMIILKQLKQIYRDYPQKLFPKIVIQPNKRELNLKKSIEELSHKIICDWKKELLSSDHLGNNFLIIYRSHCDYLGIPKCTYFTLFLQKFLRTETKLKNSFKLNMFDGVVGDSRSRSYLDMHPVFSSLRYSTYFKSIDISGIERKEVLPLLSKVIQVNKTISEIMMSNIKYLDGFSKFIGALESNKDLPLEKLDLSNNNLGDKMIKKLMIAISNLKSGIKELNITNCQLTNRGISKLFNSIKDAKKIHNTLEKLDISNNNFGEAGSKALYLWLKTMTSHNKKLYSLNLGSGNLVLNKILDLFHTHFQTKLQNLDISGSKLTDENCKTLSKFLEGSVNFKYLNISRTFLSTKSLGLIFESIQKNKNINKFFLNSSLNNSKLEGAEIIAKNLKKCTKIKYLILDENNFKIAGVKIIFESIVNNQSIRHFSISRNVKKEKNNEIGSKELALVLRNFAIENNTCKDLNISGGVKKYHLGDILNPFFESLTKNQKLNRLNISYNQIGSKGLKFLSNSLITNENLISIIFDDLYGKYTIPIIEKFFNLISLNNKTITNFPKPVNLLKKFNKKKNIQKIIEITETLNDLLETNKRIKVDRQENIKSNNTNKDTDGSIMKKQRHTSTESYEHFDKALKTQDLNFNNFDIENYINNENQMEEQKKREKERDSANIKEKKKKPLVLKEIDQELLNALKENDTVFIKKLFLSNRQQNNNKNKNIKKTKPNIAIVERKTGSTCFHYICSFGNIELLSLLLLQQNAEKIIKMQDNMGLTPLHKLMMKSPNNESIILLSDYGADFNTRDKRGWIPMQLLLHCFQKIQNIREILLLLLENGSNPNNPDHKGVTSVHLSAGAGFAEGLELLLQHGGNVDQKDNSGSTPLHRAARNGRTECVVLLLKHGAQINSLDFAGNTPIALARVFGQAKVEEVLDPKSRFEHNIIWEHEKEFAQNNHKIAESNTSYFSYTIVLLGASKCGKTKFVERFVTKLFTVRYFPTIEKMRKFRSIAEDTRILINILDVSGDKVYSSFRSNWIRQADGFILCYDTTAQTEALQELKHYYRNIENIKSNLKGKLPLILVSLKNDLKGKIIISEKEGKDLAEQFNCPFLSVSSKANLNVELAFKLILMEIKNKNTLLKPVINGNDFPLITSPRSNQNSLNSFFSHISQNENENENENERRNENENDIKLDCNEKKKKIMQEIIPFEQIIQHQSCLDAFSKFLKNEFAEENLMFYYVIKSFKKIEVEKSQLINVAVKTIVENYISTNSQYEINIDYQIRKDILTKIDKNQNIDLSIFDQAMIQIFEMLKKDSYPKFIKSTYYQELINLLLNDNKKIL
ncbi:leucine-rich repeat isoform f [Anaeramoeba flamelloides]|uniref:Leucine-rich repeat isoform f n=1 Tax=Anaeramoeba flamelloides TaxID=1746091 RepID=A0AAV7YX97_9EUKA|nr:leucine-rich repeat isoform f [Anaeramoeba flamelloides]